MELILNKKEYSKLRNIIQRIWNTGYNLDEDCKGKSKEETIIMFKQILGKIANEIDNIFMEKE